MFKRYTILLLAITLPIIAEAQPSTFFGLTLGNSYTEEQIISTVKNNGISNGPADIIQEDIDNPFNLISYYYHEAEYDGVVYPLMSFQFLPNNNRFVAANFIFTTIDDIINSSQLEDICSSIVGTLARNYPLQTIETGVDSLKRLYYNNPITSDRAIRLDKYYSKGQLFGIELSYVSSIDLALAWLLYDYEKPEIQDEFFGLKMGDVYTHSQLKTALIGKAKFLEEEGKTSGNDVTFTDAYFAGDKWDFCVISLSIKDELYHICFYNSYEENDINEENTARKSFDSIKKRLDEKYGAVETENEDGILSAFYPGGNDMSMVLTLRKSKSKGGAYRKYLNITYYKKSILSNQNKAHNDEL